MLAVSAVLNLRAEFLPLVQHQCFSFVPEISSFEMVINEISCSINITQYFIEMKCICIIFLCLEKYHVINMDHPVL